MIPRFDMVVRTRVAEIWAEIHDDLITTRYLKNVYPGDRIVVGRDHFEIVGVVDRPGRTRLVELHVKKLQASVDMPGAQW